MIFGPLMMILFWAGLVAIIFFAARWFGGGSPRGSAPGSSRKTALEILQERFAGGEIDEDEFETRKQALQG
jgi:putative membrane protein